MRRNLMFLLLALSCCWALSASVAGVPLSEAIQNLKQPHPSLASVIQNARENATLDDGTVPPDSCSYACPDSARWEDEDECGRGANDGCLNPLAFLYETIACGNTVCGTLVARGEVFDADFYLLTLTAETRVSWNVAANGPFGAAIVSFGTDCDSLVPYAYSLYENCDSASLSACLQPGAYFLVVLSNANPGPDTVVCYSYTANVECGECGQCDPVFVDASTLPVCECISLCEGQITPIVICGGPGGPENYPTGFAYPGCARLPDSPIGCDVTSCPPSFIVDGTIVYDSASGCWILLVVGETSGCICLCLDGFLPVELQSFNAVAGDHRVDLMWQTASETNTDRFEIERDGSTIARVESQGSSAAGHRYTFADEETVNGVTYEYTLVEVDQSGIRHTLATAGATPSEGNSVVTEFALHQNYPNPFNPTTQIRFDLAAAGRAELKVYNLAGQEVAVLADGEFTAGSHVVNFNAKSLPSGMYFYRLVSGTSVDLRKMMLLK